MVFIWYLLLVLGIYFYLKLRYLCGIYSIFKWYLLDIYVICLIFKFLGYMMLSWYLEDIYRGIRFKYPPFKHRFFFTSFFGFSKITNVSGFLQKFKLYQVQCIRLTKKCIRFFYQVVKLYQGGKYQVFEIFDFLPGWTLKFSALGSDVCSMRELS